MDDYPLKIIIVDDEAPAREEMIHLLEEIKNIEIAGIAKDGLEAVEILNTMDIDIALLDIQMPGMSGIEVARKMMNKKIKTLFIFTTAYDAYAIDAFEIHAVDYLLKPIRQEKLKKAIKIASKRLNSANRRDLDQNKLELFMDSYMKKNQKQTNQYISIFQGGQIIPVKISTILYAEARGRFVWICTGKNEYKTNTNFREIEELLYSPDFFVCHRSFIVKVDAIEAIDLWVNNSYRLKLKGTPATIPVSRSHKEKLQELLGI